MREGTAAVVFDDVCFLLLSLGCLASVLGFASCLSFLFTFDSHTKRRINSKSLCRQMLMFAFYFE